MSHALRSLRKEENRARKIDLLQILLTLHDNSRLLHLAREAHNFGVTSLAENNNLTTHALHLLVRRNDLTLQLRHNGAGGIDNSDAQLLGSAVGCRGLSVSTDEEVATTEILHILVCDGLKAQRLQTLHLHTVMHDVAQRIYLTTELGHSRLGLRDSSHHTEAETRILINLDNHNLRLYNLLVALHKPRHLLLNTHMAVVQHHSVLGLAQR